MTAGRRSGRYCAVVARARLVLAAVAPAGANRAAGPAEIAFDHTVDGESQIFVMNADGSASNPVTSDLDGASFDAVWNE